MRSRRPSQSFVLSSLGRAVQKIRRRVQRAIAQPACRHDLTRTTGPSQTPDSLPKHARREQGHASPSCSSEFFAKTALDTGQEPQTTSLPAVFLDVNFVDWGFRRARFPHPPLK
mmetsp:Transcript_18836/g.38833  ORF Transcript_18836/g.38833 Transcript_18836/m.38833 type:complete len:114 (-) Transcript_18836:77-418(-)